MEWKGAHLLPCSTVEVSINRDGAVVRTRASHCCGLGSVPRPGFTCWWKLFLILVFAPRVFHRVLRFSPLHKNQRSKFQFDLETADEKSHFVDCTLPNSHHLLLLLLLLLLLPTLLSLLSQSLLVFFLCISRAQNMHLGHQSPKSIILFIH